MLRTFLLAVAVAVAACSGPERPQFKSTDITGADYARDFSLTDHTGKPRHLADFRGKVVTVFFGYTQCPDVCPTSLSSMAEVLRILGPDDAGRVQVLFITVDPERDTPQLLAQYVPAFNPSFLGLYGDLPTTVAVARDFKVFYKKQGEGPNYTVDHSAGTFVFDPAGRLRLYVKHGESPTAIASDIKLLLTGH
jgi:protein SCO1/2